MRTVFAGTPEFAARALDALARSRHEVVLVLTQPDKPAGRGMQLQVSPVKALAHSLGLPVRQPRTLKDPSEWPALQAAGADVMVVAAYGLILPQAVLDMPRRGAINIHASLLPRWRGAAPIQRALLAGDIESGISIMQMDAGLDTGPVLLMERTPVTDEDTAGSLHDRLADIGARLIVAALDRIEDAPLPAEPQPSDGATYASKIERVEARIDWSAPATSVWRQVRAFNPVPGAYTRMQGKDVKVWRAEPASGSGNAGVVIAIDPAGPVVACGSGALRLLELQRAGARRVAAADYVRGAALRVGDALGG
jgi:methionyl-tRNA formyltransferase